MLGGGPQGKVTILGAESAGYLSDRRGSSGAKSGIGEGVSKSRVTTCMHMLSLLLSMHCYGQPAILRVIPRGGITF
jgi:hypothetical protein